MLFQYNLTKLVIILNWLLALFPISFILGNLVINLHVLIFITLGCIYLNKKKIKLNEKFPILVFLFFCLFLIISSIYNQANVEKSLLFLRILIFYYISILLLKDKIFNLKIIFNIFSITVIIVCLDLIFQYFVGYNITGLKSQRFGVTSFFGDERVAGSFLQYFSFFLIYIVFEKFDKKSFKNEIIKSLLIALISIAIFVSAQRMPMVIWLSFLIFYGAIFYKSRLKNVLFSIFVLGIFINLFSSDNEKKRYFSFYGNAKGIIENSINVYKVNKDEKKLNEIKNFLAEQNFQTKKQLKFVAGSGHSNLFGNGIFIWNNNKFLGIGLKNFYAKCAEYKLLRCSTHPHNYYLDILVTVGLFGFTIIIIYLIFLILRSLQSLKIYWEKNQKEKFNLTLIFFINFLMNFFPLKSSGSFFTTFNITYTIIILALLTSQIKKKYFY
jgi:O-antigen ligase